MVLKLDSKLWILVDPITRILYTVLKEVVILIWNKNETQTDNFPPMNQYCTPPINHTPPEMEYLEL